METRPAANGRRLGLRRARPARPGDSTARVTASAGRSGEGDPGRPMPGAGRRRRAGEDQAALSLQPRTTWAKSCRLA
ncbi:putative uncharacterized protein BRD3OS isoform X3 [Pipistrellus kuhlii]|uniref:putative uncharacterized protein BRD3OS isoform X3 n=1 Tax=Pipistrellus kuhlii TaxID=59472 RepID=UPI001E273601|nr:putative uncharacterized protein BRD3OS isoform X3 [Pipistrellus kuhlii]